MKIATAGTLESNDCLMTVQSHQGIKIEIESIVFDQFGDQIEKVIRDTLQELKITNIHVMCKDKGALDYCIKARLITAIQRLGDSYAS
ncbi:MAG: citrate lyase acyl carrier protein [Bacillota bacterium]|nr:MAG: citrate lyase acyl carrier protein [Bacillota bacterium]